MQDRRPRLQIQKCLQRQRRLHAHQGGHPELGEKPITKKPVTCGPGAPSRGLTMKITSSRPWLLVLILGLAINVHATPAELLRQAYTELATADHNYKGH